MVSGSHDNNYKDECLLGCNNGETDTSIVMFRGTCHLTIQHHIIAGEIFHGRDIHNLHVRCKHKYTNRVHSFHWHVQNVSIPCRSQELLPFFSVIHPFLPPYSTNYSSILPHFILSSVSWSTSQLCCFQIHI